MSFRVRRRKNRDRRELFLWLVTFAMAAIVAAGVIIFVGERTKITGSSMEPVLSDGDQVILDKLTYRFKAPERFDIVVFPGPGDQKRLFVKRIIGLPGEIIRIANGVVYINDREISWDYAKDYYTHQGTMTKTVKLGKDDYFVLGDNRENSLDSRYKEVGSVRRDEIIGRVIFRIYPWKQAGRIQKE